MRKEVLLAILAGAFFGLIIAFGVWRLNSTLSNGSDNKTEASPTPTPEFGITIAKPEVGQVVTESPTKITGITEPNSYVVASLDDEDFVTKSKGDGAFEIEVDLVGGINQILLTSITDSGQMASTTITVAHSTELSFEKDSDTTQEESTDSSDVIREKVQEKVLKAKTIPYFYMGTVTDISESTIQIRTSDGVIKQVATTEDGTNYVSLVNDREEIEFSDVAIGDFMLAMGFKNSNEVLDAQRVLVIETPGEIERKIIYGQISSISTGEIELNVENQDSPIVLDFPKTWKGPDLDELSENESLIATGTFENQVFTPRSIFQPSEIE
jgi:hypothetical protein